MKKKLLLLFAISCITYCATAQVLFSENFNSLPLGKLSNDPTGTTPGQNGWYVREVNASTDVSIVTETGKGNVVHIKPNTNSDALNGRLTQKDIPSLWNNRTAGSNILHIEFQYYLLNEFFDAGIVLRGTSLDDVSIFFAFNQQMNSLDADYINSIGTNGTDFLNLTPAVMNTWISVEVFFDYNTSKLYVYVPTLNILKSHTFYSSLFPLQFQMSGRNFISSNTNSGIKYDNIKISAIGTLPTYLSVDDVIASKFNVFPNPATNIVTITNNENISIQQLELFDINGRNVKSIKLNNEDLVQLNIEDIANGTYLLHIKTKDGTAVKKIIKN